MLTNLPVKNWKILLGFTDHMLLMTAISTNAAETALEIFTTVLPTKSPYL